MCENQIDFVWSDSPLWRDNSVALFTITVNQITDNHLLSQPPPQTLGSSILETTHTHMTGTICIAATMEGTKIENYFTWSLVSIDKSNHWILSDTRKLMEIISPTSHTINRLPSRPGQRLQLSLNQSSDARRVKGHAKSHALHLEIGQLDT